MTPAIRTAAPADLVRLEAALAAAASAVAPEPLAAAIAAGRVLLAEATPGGPALGLAVVAPAGAAGALWLWAAPGRTAHAAASALAAAGVTAGAAAALAAGDEQAEPSLASLHVQTDDAAWVERTVRQVLPRLGRSAGTVVWAARDGWTAVHDDLCDRDRKAQRRLAEELSVRLGLVAVALAVEEGEVVRMLLFERGRMVDEYLSVPAWDGPLPPGEQMALAVNPTLVARLTGADAAAVRAVARTAATPVELPPAAELAQELGALLGLHGGALGHTAALQAATAGGGAGAAATVVEHG